MRSWILTLMTLMATSCVSPQEQLIAFNADWVGRPVDHFVDLNRVPSGTYVMSDGRQIHEFNFDGGQARLPSHPPHSGIDSGPSHTACVLRVEADSDGIITSIQIASDSVGSWLSSRCHEVLPPVRASGEDGHPAE